MDPLKIKEEILKIGSWWGEEVKGQIINSSIIISGNTV